MSFIICTDSGCDLPIEQLEANNVVVHMMTYNINGEDFRDTMRTDSLHEFFDKMRGGAVPRTSQVNYADYIEFWTPLLEQGKPIVHIALGSGVSGTYANGVLAAKELMEKHEGAQIYIVDSTFASTGYGILVLEAVKMRNEGKSAEECFNWLEENKININVWFTTDELLYLRRSGRCSRISALFGTAFKICPLLNLDAAGHLIAQERIRGFDRAVERIHTLIGNSVVDAAGQTLYVSHTDSPERARLIGESLKKRFGFGEVQYSNIGVVIGSHCGPDLVAIFYMGKPRTPDGKPE